ncbi:hypothetical protein MRX96_040715 [Rhipicephalus microplus]
MAKCFNSNHGITRRDHVQLKKCSNNLKQTWKVEAAREKREHQKTDDLWQVATPVEPSQLPTPTDADEDSRCTSIEQPDAEATFLWKVVQTATKPLELL